MAYRYNSWRHSKLIEFNEKFPKAPYEVVLRSAYSFRKLKVYGRYKTRAEAKIACSCIVDNAQS